MLSKLVVLVFLLFISSLNAFGIKSFVPSIHKASVAASIISSSSTSPSSQSSLITALYAKANSKTPAVPNDFWPGEWICADCGYIYDRDYDGGGLYFEELKKGFICPQCSAPRKRYAKKVGDTWGVTRDGGDLPIYALTIGGLALTTWFALVYVPTL